MRATEEHDSSGYRPVPARAPHIATPIGKSRCPNDVVA